MDEGNIGANHLIIAGYLTDLDYARADYLAMHLEQHMAFEIERHGKLPEQWEEYYNNVLVPLEITSEEIKNGKPIIYTREGRIVGDYNAFAKLMKLKYNVSVEAPESWLKEIEELHEQRAKMAIADSKAATFNEKVDAFLKQREEAMQKMNELLENHKETVSKTEKTIDEIESLVTFLKPTTEALYNLHHYPVKEEQEESAEGESNQTEGYDTTETEKDTDATETDTEAHEGEHDEQTNESEEQQQQQEQNQEEQSQEQQQEEHTEEKTEDKPEGQEGEQQPNEEKHEGEDGEEGEKHEGEEGENAEGEEHNPEEDSTEKNPEEEEKPKEEEELGEPDPEAVELQTKLQESYKLPELSIVKQAIQDGDKTGLAQFLEEFTNLFEESNKLVQEERFKWKKFEKLVIEMNEKATLAANMLKISIISAEQLQIKAIETELDKYDNFIIEDVDKDVLEAGAIKYAATYRFV